jgi:hypothetical protein
MMDCLALDNSVSPQAPISFLSCIILRDWVRGDREKIKNYSRRYEPIDGHGVHSSVGVHCKQVLVESWVDTNDVFDLMVHLQLQRVHGSIKVNLYIGSTPTVHQSISGELTLFRKCMITIWESRFPRLPGRDRSVGLPILTTTRYGTTCPEHS